jgi:hypothetical protein
VSIYQKTIRESMAAAGRIAAADPRHVEAWMRLEHPTLDALSRSQFDAEVRIALECIAAGPLADSETLATSMGL